jgi:hypothetical protein
VGLDRQYAGLVGGMSDDKAQDLIDYVTHLANMYQDHVDEMNRQCEDWDPRYKDLFLSESKIKASILATVARDLEVILNG